MKIHCASVTICSFQKFSAIYFNWADKMNWTEEIYGQIFLQSGRIPDNTHIHLCVGFTSLYRNCSDTSPYLSVKIFFDYTSPCSSFDFAIRFERTWFQTTLRFQAPYCLQLVAVLPNMDIGHPRWWISNWSKMGMFSLIPQSLSAKLVKWAVFLNSRDLEF